ncbi:MAG: hypothetical protein JWM89_2387 [Acidimicrobiales bacterium]|nr:hypothetical protein [Acidimicrobiales bacterium]
MTTDQRAVPRVVALVPDLMDRSRLGGLGRPGEVDLVHVRAAGELREAVAVAPTALVVVDLGRPGVLDAVRAGLGARVVGFASHVDTDLIAAAEAAGCTEVLPRSRFFARLAELL